MLYKSVRQTAKEEDPTHLPPKKLPECHTSRKVRIATRILAGFAMLVPAWFLTAFAFTPRGSGEYGSNGDRPFENFLGWDTFPECNPVMYSSASWLAPDLTFGTLTITQARAADLSWNIIMGRGLQAVASVVTYKVACSALLRIAETVAVSYELIETVALRPFSLSAIVPLSRAVMRTRGWRSKATLVFLLASAALIVALPTLGDLTTGYIQSSDLYTRFSNGTMATELPLPGCMVYGNENGTEYQICEAMMTVGDQICNCTKYVTATLECVPGTGYEWGFSTIWVLIVLCMLFIWSCGMYGIWMDASRFSKLQRSGKILGVWTAITDLGGSLERDLGPHLSSYSEAEIGKHVVQAPRLRYTIKREKTESGEESDRVVLARDIS